MTPAIARADVRLLALVARLPFASTRHLAVLSGEPASAGVYRRAARLLERGLLGCVAGPSASGVGRSPRLLYPTDSGLRLLASEAEVDPVVLARELGLRRAGLPRRLAGLPALLASYELLTRLAVVCSDAVNLRVWEQPWRRTYQIARHRRPQVARVPASTELTWTRPEIEQAVCGRFLLIPDTGGLSIPSFRVQIGRLVDLQRATGERLPVLVVATTSVARVQAWTTLLEQVSRARGRPPLQVNVTTWATIGQDRQSAVGALCTRVWKSPRPRLGSRLTAQSTCGPRPIRAIATRRLSASGLQRPHWPRRLSISRNGPCWTSSVVIRSCRRLCSATPSDVMLGGLRGGARRCWTAGCCAW